MTQNEKTELEFHIPIDKNEKLFIKGLKIIESSDHEHDWRLGLSILESCKFTPTCHILLETFTNLDDIPHSNKKVFIKRTIVDAFVKRRRRFRKRYRSLWKS